MNMKYMICLALLCNTGLLSAQQLTVSGGGDIRNSTGAVSYSVGQIFYSSQGGGSGRVQEGLQQPYARAAAVVPYGADHSPGISVFPNPTTGLLTVNLPSPDVQTRYTVTDIQGRFFGSGMLSLASDGLSLAPYPPALYILTVMPSGMKPKTFTIIKK